MIFNNIIRSKNFEKDFRKILKRFRSLEEDIQDFINIALKLFHKEKIDNRGIIQISNLRIENFKIFKAKKFACKSLKGRGSQSGIRIIYAYFQEQDVVEFIEIYFKGEKENEDKERILEYIRLKQKGVNESRTR